MSEHIKQSLLDLIPKGDGYNSAYAGTLSDAVEYIEQIEHQRDEFQNALDLIASWVEGDEVSSSFDEPHSAKIARAALAKVRGEDEAHELFPGTLDQLRDLRRGK